MEISAVTALEPSQIRAVLPVFLGSKITDPAANAQAVKDISDLVNGWSDQEIRELLNALGELGEAQKVYLANPEARILSRLWAAPLLLETQVVGLENLRNAALAGPTAILCNHTSYMDSSTIDTLLTGVGAEDLANMVMSAAGPKVYSTLFRRFAALCLNTLPVPQSTSLGHTARMSPRELARLALNSMKLAQDSMQDGNILLIFPEGSRTRTGRLQPFLQGVYRYLAVDGLRIVPAALVGCHKIMNMENETCVPGPVSLTFGQPITIETKKVAKDALKFAHSELAKLLPPDMQPI